MMAEYTRQEGGGIRHHLYLYLFSTRLETPDTHLPPPTS